MIAIKSGTVLLPDGWRSSDLYINGASINSIGPVCEANETLDAIGLLVLPGLVDAHGDAFERQIMPRPGVRFDLGVALRETDRQLAANGITTAFHAITCSWEPGLRGIETVRELLAALERLNNDLAVDTRVHLRHEVFNLDHEDEIEEWIWRGKVHVFSFNDHMRGIVQGGTVKASKIKGMIERAGLGEAAFTQLVKRVAAREAETPASMARLAKAAREAGIVMMSHDDRHAHDRAAYRQLGCWISEFPMNEETTSSAIAAGEFTVFGAPNVLRGGSHIGCPSASDMAARGLCSILASDYYYPALLAAPFALSQRGACSLADAWSFVSDNPARALGLTDRGRIEPGLRADMVLVDPRAEGPRLVATIIAGKIAWLAESGRYTAIRDSSFDRERHMQADSVTLEPQLLVECMGDRPLVV